MNILEQFFNATAAPMTPPPSYGPFHIIYTIAGFALCIFLAWKLRKISDKAANWILFIMGVILSLSEVYKQFFCYFHNNNSYNWGEFPFQLCSVPMYMCLIAPWLKAGKLQRSMYSFMILYNLLGGAISFAEPSGLLLDDWFLTMHALIWHMLLVFIGLFLCFSKRGGNKISDYVGSTCTFIALCGVAFLMNLFVQEVIGQHMNMFFVGPGNSPLAVFSLFSQWFGWYINTFIYIFALSLGTYLIFLIIYVCQNKRLPSRKKQPVA